LVGTLPLRFTLPRAIPSISPSPALLRLVTDSDYLTALEGFQMLKASWNQWNEVFQKNRSPAENNDCDLPIAQVVLVGIQSHDLRLKGHRISLSPQPSEVHRSQAPPARRTAPFGIRIL
jgi:hypothetical protein